MENFYFVYWGWAAMLIGILALSLLITNLFEQLFVDKGRMQESSARDAQPHDSFYLAELSGSMGITAPSLSNEETGRRSGAFEGTRR